MLRVIAVFILGLGAGVPLGAYLLAKIPVISPPGEIAPIRCPEYDQQMWEIFPKGMITSPSKAAEVADAVESVSGNRRWWRKLVVSSEADAWVVSERPLFRNERGGGYIVRVSRCDAAVSSFEIAQ